MRIKVLSGGRKKYRVAFVRCGVEFPNEADWH